MTVDWLRILPDEDYRFHMGLRQGRGAEFFAPSEDVAVIRFLRRSLLQEALASYAVLPFPEPPAVREALDLLTAWTDQAFPDTLTAAVFCEPDWLILTPDAEGLLRVTAGVVCFPSSWSLPEKAGLPVSAVHGPVPGLNASLSRSIDTFLARLLPDTVWLRDNWGLTADAALDHHPRHRLPPLNAEATLETAWLRLEQQLFAKLPGGGVLFAIRVSVHRLDFLALLPGIGLRLARALETMPPEIAHYKGITDARQSLAALLRAMGRTLSE